MKILQNAGRLVNGHGLNRNDALQFAIDLHPLLMGELPLTLREIASMAELLEVRKAIPDDLPEITRLSAAICYFQQLKAHQNDASAIGIIQQRLVRMEYIQSKLPRGCTKDCIHQGAHIRSTYELNTSQLADFKSLTESFDISPTEHDEKLLKKAPKLKSLDPQFGIDATRAPFSATRAGNPDTSFTALELQKQNSFAKFINAKLSKWVDSYIEFAGGDNASKVLSRFTSQTIIGVMKTSTALATSTPDGLLCYAASSYGTTSFIYQMDRVDEVGKESVVVHNTAMFNAIALTIDQDFKDLEKIDNSIKSFELPLVPNAGDKKASEHTYSVRYDFKGSLARADLDAGITTCTPLTVSVAYDLIIDEAELDQRQDSGEAMKLEHQASAKIYFPKI